jgi:hypothetical protein
MMQPRSNPLRQSKQLARGLRALGCHALEFLRHCAAQLAEVGVLASASSRA